MMTQTEAANSLGVDARNLVHNVKESLDEYCCTQFKDLVYRKFLSDFHKWDFDGRDLDFLERAHEEALDEIRKEKARVLPEQD